MASVSLRGVKKNYGALNVVKSLNLEISDGEFIVFVGPSGCGKSTTLRMLAGLENVSGGEIYIDGAPVSKHPPRRRNIAMVFQDYALYPHKTVRENMGFSLKIQGLSKEESQTRIHNAANMLGISHLLDRRPAQLSGGQRQRVAMGRAIVRRPKVFLFDEPLSNLDAKLRGQVRTEIKRLHQQIGTTIIYVTHDQVEAMTLADRIVIFKGGDIEQIGTPEEVYNKPLTVFVGGFVGSPAMNFVNATIASGRLNFVDGNTISLNAVNIKKQANLEGKEVIVGIRPEHFAQDRAQFSKNNNTQSQSIKIFAHVIEPLGSDTLVHFMMGESMMTARLPPEFKPNLGEEVHLNVDPTKIHLFDCETKRALHA